MKSCLRVSSKIKLFFLVLHLRGVSHDVILCRVLCLHSTETHTVVALRHRQGSMVHESRST